MKVITVMCRKGGVGKTTTSEALILALREKGYKVLALDLDSQQNLTNYFNPEYEHDAFDLVDERKHISIEDIIEKDLIAGGRIIYLSEYLRNNDSTIIKERLNQVSSKYDFLIIDTPPAIDHVVYSSIELTNYVIVPCECTNDGVLGALSTLDLIEAKRKKNNLDLEILGIVLTMYKKNYSLHQQFKKSLEDKGYKVFTSTIRESQAINNSKIAKSNFIKNKSIKATQDYISLTNEILKLI